MKFNKLAIITLTTSSLFVACSDEISYDTYENQYIANAANIKNAGQAMDLGLPSGTKWADMNVGATSGSDNGVLFVWGDITGTQVLATSATSYKDVTTSTSVDDLFEMYKGEEKTGIAFDTVNVHKEAFSLSEFPLTKMDSIREVRFDSLKTAYKDRKLECSINVDGLDYEIIANVIDSTAFTYYASTQGGFKDDTGASITAPIYSIIKDAQHDPATANWGNGWRMPTSEEFQELIDNCKWEFTGTGYTVTGPNKNSIFLPGAGYRFGQKWYGNGNAGYYASGQIFGSYHFPSKEEQRQGSKGSISDTENMPDMLVFQHGLYDNSVSVYHNLSSSLGISIRPVK